MVCSNHPGLTRARCINIESDNVPGQGPNNSISVKHGNLVNLRLYRNVAYPCFSFQKMIIFDNCVLNGKRQRMGGGVALNYVYSLFKKDQLYLNSASMMSPFSMKTFPTPQSLLFL